MNSCRLSTFASFWTTITSAFTLAKPSAQEHHTTPSPVFSFSVRFDSNCITPGTDFMFKLTKAFQAWIEYKMDTDPFWQQNGRVVFSGPDVPGEGEHKVIL